MTVLSKAHELGLTLTICSAFGTIQGHQLNREEKFALVTKSKRGSRFQTKGTNMTQQRDSHWAWRGDGHV